MHAAFWGGVEVSSREASSERSFVDIESSARGTSLSRHFMRCLCLKPVFIIFTSALVSSSNCQAWMSSHLFTRFWIKNIETTLASVGYDSLVIGTWDTNHMVYPLVNQKNTRTFWNDQADLVEDIRALMESSKKEHTWDVSKSKIEQNNGCQEWTSQQEKQIQVSVVNNRNRNRSP